MVIAAGVFRMGAIRFAAVIAGARAVRYFSIAFLAVHYGEPAIAYLKQYGLAVSGVLAALFAAVVVWQKLRRATAPLSLFSSELPEAHGDIA
jgi:hypothetical protein